MGLGLKNLSAWNNALLAKTLWKIHKKEDSLWIKWVHHQYINVDSVWHWRLNRDNWPLIKKILSIRDELLCSHSSIDVAVLCIQGWFYGSGGLV